MASGNYHTMGQAVMGAASSVLLETSGICGPCPWRQSPAGRLKATPRKGRQLFFTCNLQAIGT